MNIREVASKLGVSRTTITYALRGSGRLSPETRHRVLEQMRELGYTPNANAQRLATGRTGLIALDDGRPTLFIDQFGMHLARSIQYSLQQRGYSLLINIATRSEDEDARLCHWVKSRTVDGVVVVRSRPFQGSLIDEIAEAHAPCVVIGSSAAKRPYVTCVEIGNAGIHQAARLLVESGHRHIGVIDIALEESTFLKILKEALEDFNVSLPSEYVAYCALPPSVDASYREVEEGAQAFRKLMELEPRPTAIIAISDSFAFGAMREARKLGLRVPEDISIIGYEDMPIAEYAEPPLTSVRVDCSALGEAATEALLELMEAPETPASRFVETRLILRQSVGPIPRAQKDG